MGLFKEAFFAFRARRFFEWFIMDRPQLPIICGIAFYSLLYCNYKYDFVSRWKGQPTYNDYSYVKQAAEQKRAHLTEFSNQSSSKTT